MLARFNRSVAVGLGIAASLVVGTAAALAQDNEVIVRGLPEGVRMERVSYGDLDLRFIAHLRILNDRVGRAVRHVCDFEPHDYLNTGYRNCATAAWAGARPQMQRAYLRANHLAG